MKPFLLLATRAEEEAADDEYRGFLEAGGLKPDQLVRLRLDKAPLGKLDVHEYSGIIVGGSSFNTSDPVASKSDIQLRVENELGDLLDRVIAADFPFLGACYGIGLVTARLGGVVDRQWSEPPGPTAVELTAAGARDQLFGGLPPRFDAFVGHKEACSRLPEGAVLLASGPRCPVQAFRMGRNVYATQFHPELTQESIITRIRIYKNSGYFDPSEFDDVIAEVTRSSVTEPATIVRKFVEQFS
ncbi:GMP synthase (glutamine-hydrolysing) [Glaciihabitans tibetensis]|uniref:GMP synthase (Glutamine-hydrolysing) n=1 Tax=Glaciihabitans tibetensis TaxID=1266600 RepID=A0A2T0VEH7_9MICO|nr:glutamine amidotransferase [Glaciihabitans tibetensis]PRY68579.1 GMP synthase (glutamine-hydrolysing) [Glaciihabitans tibetensis]